MGCGGVLGDEIYGKDLEMVADTSNMQKELSDIYQAIGERNLEVRVKFW